MPGKPKVLIVTERFHPEEFIVNDLAAEWAAGGMDVSVLTQAPSYPFGKIFKGYRNKLFSYEGWDGVAIFRFFTVTGYRDSLFLKLLNYLNFAVTGTVAALFKAGGYDRIFVYQTGPLTLAIPAVIAGKFHGVPVTIWTQDIWPDMVYSYGFRKGPLLDWFLGLIIRFVYRGCDDILVSCEGFARRISEYVPGREIKHFPNWPTVRPDESGARAALPPGFNFTFAGNVGKLQNLGNVLLGFRLARKENPGINLNIVGDGSHLEELKLLAAGERIEGVNFWGRKPSSEMPAFFRASDVMIVSLNDTPGLNLTVPAKFQAYLAFHKPMLCAIAGEVRTLAEKHGVGVCADPASPQAIKDAFLRFAAMDKDELAAFSERAKALVEGLYSRERIIGGMGEIVSAVPASK